MAQNRWIWFVAFIMAGLSAWLFHRSIESKPKPEPAKVKTAKVLVAKVSIPARTVIKGEWLEFKEIPVDALPADSTNSAKEVLGKVTRSEILSGEPVRKGRLLADQEKLGLPLLIPSGYRGITVAVDEVIGVAGFVKPGDLVDVLVTLNEGVISKEHKVTMTLLQGVQVLAIAQDLDPPSNNEQAKKGKLSSSVTLAVNPLQAEKLVFAGENGKIRLSLRPLNYIETVEVRPVSAHNLEERKPVKEKPVVRRRPKLAPVMEEVKPHRQIEVISGSQIKHVKVD